MFNFYIKLMSIGKIDDNEKCIQLIPLLINAIND